MSALLYLCTMKNDVTIIDWQKTRVNGCKKVFWGLNYNFEIWAEVKALFVMPNQPSIKQASMLLRKEFAAVTYSDYKRVLRAFPMAENRCQFIDP